MTQPYRTDWTAAQLAQAIQSAETLAGIYESRYGANDARTKKAERMALQLYRRAERVKDRAELATFVTVSK